MKRFLLFVSISVFFSSFTFQSIELENRKILDDKVEILLPKDFGLMPEDMLNLKYPSANRPTLVYSDEDGTVNIAFNHTSSIASQKEIDDYEKYLVSTFNKSFPTASWEGHGVKEINGRKVGYIEVTTPAIDTQVYNLLFFTDLGGRLLLCTFNCTVKKKPIWLESAKKIFNSLVIK